MIRVHTTSDIIRSETPTICSDDSVYVEVLEGPDEVFVNYEWEGDWQDLGGQVYDETTSGNGAWVSAGMFRVEVEDESGCFGQRVFQIQSVDSDIPDITIPNMCNGLDTIAFTDGYFSTSEGDFNIYLITSNNAGWEGSFVNVLVNGEAVSTLTLNNAHSEHFQFLLFLETLSSLNTWLILQTIHSILFKYSIVQTVRIPLRSITYQMESYTLLQLCVRLLRQQEFGR